MLLEYLNCLKRQKYHRKNQSLQNKKYLLIINNKEILKMDKISLANSHLPQLVGLVLMSIGYTLGNNFYLPEVNKK